MYIYIKSAKSTFFHSILGLSLGNPWVILWCRVLTYSILSCFVVPVLQFLVEGPSVECLRPAA